MKLKYLAIPALMSAALIGSAPASAGDYSFEFLSTDHTYDVHGIFSTLTSGLTQEITGISGLVAGSGGGGAISGVVPVGTAGTNYNFDNLLTPAGPQFFNTNGVLFTTSASTPTFPAASWNLWGNSATDYELHSYTGLNGGAVDLHGTLNVAAVPEPETYAMMMAGLGMMGFMVRRRKRQTI